MSTDLPLISVIVPVYQVEPYLDKCVSSLVQQTYSHLEILLIDDGSPDNCPALCDAWADRDPRILVFHKENGGLSDARNYGLDHASGDYITFVDSDDYVAPNYVAVLYDTLRAHQADVSMCNHQMVDVQGTALPSSAQPLQAGVCIGTDILYRYFAFQGSGPILVTACGKLYRSELFRSLHFSTGRCYEDEFLYVPMYQQAGTVAIAEEMLYYYVQRHGSILHSSFSAKRFEDLRALSEERLTQFPSKSPLYRKSAADYALRMFSVIDQTGEKSLIRQMAKLYRRYIWYVLYPCVDLPLWRKMVYCVMSIAPRRFAKILHQKQY